MPAGTTIEVSDDLDDMMSSLGIDNKPVTQEEIFLNDNVKNRQKLDVLRYFLRGSMAEYYSRLRLGVVPCKTVTGANKIPVYRPITAMDYGRTVVRYYLHMQHLPWFTDMPSRKALDIDKIIEIIVAEPDVKKVIETDPK